MNISYNWLKEYVDFDLTPMEVAAALTSVGLETGSVEEVQTIKGGLVPRLRLFQSALTVSKLSYAGESRKY